MGAEDLDAYGTWESTKDYGWIWRPNITVINNYSDWAPYRYGSWVWCSPYGWTWIGDEPLGGRLITMAVGSTTTTTGLVSAQLFLSPSQLVAAGAVAFISIDFNFSPYYCWYRFIIISEIRTRVTISTIVVACGRSAVTIWQICAATILLT